jgi:hypothetical protein
MGLKLPARLVKNALLISGLYELESVRRTPSLQEALRLTPADALRASPAWLPAPARGTLATVVGAEESEELDFSCSSSSAAASNPNDPNNHNNPNHPQATKAVSSSVAEEVLPVSNASASCDGKAIGQKGAQATFFNRYFGGHGAPVAKAKKAPAVVAKPAVEAPKKKGRKERNAEDVQHLVSSDSPYTTRAAGGGS